jgi:hypothetical protein
MGRNWRTSLRGLAGLAAGALLVTIGASAVDGAVPAKGGNLPKDACALLSAADVAELVPSATAEPVNVTKTTIGCVWQDPGPTPGVLDNLSVTVNKLPATPAQVKASLQAEAKATDAERVKGLGDAAFQVSRISVTTEVAVLKGKLLVGVHFSGADAVTDEQAAATLALARKVVKQV